MKKPLAHVTDHAVLRYLERVKGVDIDAVRDELGRVVDRAIELGAGAAIIDGVKYILNDKTIVTCAEVKQVPLRGRAMRRRERAGGQAGLGGRGVSLHPLLSIRPVGGFGLIMADPPWSYEMRSEKGYAKAPEAQYATMPLAEIMTLPVEALAAKDCVLWLWAVNPQLPQALDVLKAWGFTFKTAGTWLKRSTRGKVNFGTGYILRSSNEPFLIGTRGNPKTTRSTRSSVITHDAGVFGHDPAHWPNGTVTIEASVREHSRKPDEAYLACEELMPNAQRLDLFSRTDRTGWRAWGAETGKFGAAP